MIRSQFLANDGSVKMDLSRSQLKKALDDKNGVLWLDVMNEAQDETRALFSEVFQFHPLAIDDALVQVHVPKIDDWGDYVYLTLHSMTFNQERDDLLETQELDIFLGPHYLVTYRDQVCDCVDQVWAHCQRDERTAQRGAANLLYQVMEAMANSYMLIIDRLDDTLEKIEHEIFGDPKSTVLEFLFTTKRSLLTLRRILTPQREVVNKLARGDFGVVTPKDRSYFRDVYDHYVRLHDISENMRDLVGGALETYLSVVNNRLNDVMKTLTIITTIFMPISFIAGFFGMNFFPTPKGLADFTSPGTFILVSLLILAAPVSMFLWLRSRKWI